VINIIEHAAWVHKLANEEYFEHILAGFQFAASEKGYRFVEGGKQRVLAEDEQEHFRRAIVRARLRFLMPKISAYDLDRLVERDSEDGYSEQWLASVLNALEKRGIVMEKIDPAAVESHPE
jgi:hypothetical protein